MISKQQSTQGFIINKDLMPNCINLYKTYAALQKTPSHQASTGIITSSLPLLNNAAHHSALKSKSFLILKKTSLQSARSQLKQHCNNIITGQVYTTMHNDTSEHLHLLPSILNSQTSYPLFDMNRSNTHHWLQNWSFDIALYIET
jgi:hypothetical protein